MLPKSDVIELSIGVDAALKYVVSMGTVPPSPPKKVIRKAPKIIGPSS